MLFNLIKVCNYFETKLLPTFKHSSSIWVLKSAGILHPENGITNNCSESMNAVLHRLQNWKQVPLDVVCYSLFQLSNFYLREIERGFHQCGSWEVHGEFSFLCRDPSMMPNLPKVIDPKEIVARAKGDIAGQLNGREDDGDGDSDSNNGDSAVNCTTNSNTPTTQLGLAHEAIRNKCVSLVQHNAQGNMVLCPSIQICETCHHLYHCCHLVHQLYCSFSS